MFNVKLCLVHVVPFLIWGFVTFLFVLITVIILLSYKLLNAVQQKTAAEIKNKSLETQVQSLQIETIKYKLNPHLFKNTLNTIQSHAYQTYYALDKLANVLDYILYESDRQYVSLREEIEFAMNLIEINRLKVSPLFDLRVKNRILETDFLFDQKLIAPLITVDLIENAFKHADLQNAEAFISVLFELKENAFFLTVSNKITSKPPIKKSNSGFGSTSFKKRLEFLYGENYQLDQFTENDVYIAHLKINLLEHKTQMSVTG